MTRIWLHFICFTALCCIGSGARCALQNNIAVVGISSPANGERLPFGTPVVISAAPVNTGTASQSNVKVRAIIRNASNAIVYNDTVVVTSWISNVVINMTFRSFTPPAKGDYKLCVIAELPSDQQRSDDTSCLNFRVVYDVDLHATSVSYPAPGDSIREHTEFRVRGMFENVGVADQYDVPLRVEIRRCSDNNLFFRADSTIEELFVDSLPREFRFPSRSANYDIRYLVAGCYRIAVIARHIADSDPNNDTAYRTLTVTSVENNIEADSAITPQPNSAVIEAQMVPVSIRFKNTGTLDQPNVKVTVAVKTNNGGLVALYDTITFIDWKAGEERIAEFDSFPTTPHGAYVITAIAHLPNDEWRFDDTLRYTIYYNYQNDIRTVSIVNPQTNEKKNLGTVFQPSATFLPELSAIKEFTNVPASVVIRRCFDNAVVFTADSVIPYIHYDSGATLFKFPSIGGLGIGCYTITVSVDYSLDVNDKNDTLTQSFSIIDPSLIKNITVDSMITPPDSGFVSALGGTVPIAVRYTNTGQSSESQVQALTFVRNQDDSIIYADVRFLGLLSLETRDVSFTDWDPKDNLGIFRVYGISILSGDERASDDTVMHVINRSYANDVALVGITSPIPNQEIPEGTSFTPAALFRWQGGFGGKNNIPITLTIRSCDDTTVHYYAETWIPGLNSDMGKLEQTFPTKFASIDIRDLKPGCYIAYVAAALPDDSYRANDTLTAVFTITPGASVDPSDGLTFRLEQNYPNPTSSLSTFCFTLPSSGYVSMYLYDVTGRSYPLMSAKYLQQGSHTEVFDLPALPVGFYKYELAFRDADGQIRHLLKTMTIVK